ncbi:MAG: M28 family peptidase [Nitrososphaeria archaeon]
MIKKHILGMLALMIIFGAICASVGAYTLGLRKSEKAISGERMYRWLKEYISLGWRRAGTPECDRAALFILKKFREFGLSAHLEPFTINYWYPVKWELTVLAGPSPSPPVDRSITCYPGIWYCGQTSPEGVVAELAYVGYGTPADFQKTDVKGKIVLVDYQEIMHFQMSWRFTGAFQLAVAYGAVGFVAIDVLMDTVRTYGFEAHPELPCLTVGKKDGAYLKSLAGTSAKVRLILNANQERRITYNVVATLPGNGNIDEIIMLASHYDSWFDGAVDNGGGNMGLLELARYYAKIPREKRDRTMIFLAHSAHETADPGRNGLQVFLSQHEDIIPKIATAIYIDGFGSTGYEVMADGEIWETGYDEKRGFFTSNPILKTYGEEAIIKYKLQPCVTAPFGFYVNDDEYFYKAGIPTFHVIGKPIWYHTPLDTIDKCTPDQLERTALAHVDVIDKISNTPEGLLIAKDINPNRVPPVPNQPPMEIMFEAFPNPVVVYNPLLVYIVFMVDVDGVINGNLIKWDFGDGTPPVYGNFATYHIYTAPGKYTITLSLTDDEGAVGSTSKEISVLPP